MNYNNRLYPYPVLGINDDVQGDINVNLKYSSDGSNIKLSPTFNLQNAVLEELIKQEKASYVAQVYCRGTMYREVFQTTENVPNAFIIPAQKLSGEVEVDFFICGNSDFQYKSDSFNSDYRDYLFPIEKADIIGYAGKGKFYANKTYEDLTSVSALMNIDTNGKSNIPMYNEYDGDKITIMLCKEDYSNYQLVKSSGAYSINILLSSLVIPSLLEALYFLDDWEISKDYSEKRWYIVLKQIKDESKEDNNFKIAQNILDLPNSRMFDSLIKIIDDYE